MGEKKKKHSGEIQFGGSSSPLKKIVSRCYQSKKSKMKAAHRWVFVTSSIAIYTF